MTHFITPSNVQQVFNLRLKGVVVTAENIHTLIKSAEKTKPSLFSYFESDEDESNVNQLKGE